MRKNRMRRIFLIFFLIPCQAFAQNCGSYEYGSLFLQVVVVEEEIDGLPTAVAKNISTSWKQNNVSGTWYNNNFMVGSINRPLSEYFDVQTIDAISILNSLGASGWEAFSHVASQREYPSSVDEWYLKRCLHFAEKT